MEKVTKEMKPIWYFVGLMLSTMGVVVLTAGIANYLSPPARDTVLSRLHPEFWWGLVMIAVGLIFFFMNRHPKAG
jgi:predicted membrane channel-forming protein YqfA (hemolysin III family)